MTNEYFLGENSYIQAAHDAIHQARECHGFVSGKTVVRGVQLKMQRFGQYLVVKDGYGSYLVKERWYKQYVDLEIEYCLQGKWRLVGANELAERFYDIVRDSLTMEVTDESDPADIGETIADLFLDESISSEDFLAIFTLAFGQHGLRFRLPLGTAAYADAWESCVNHHKMDTLKARSAFDCLGITVN